MKRYFYFILSFSILLWTGCGITQPVRVIEEGETKIISSLGGPIVPVGNITIPLPYLNAGILYGAKPNLTVIANTHITALLYKDVGIDGGIATRLFPEKGIRPEITFNGRMYFFWDAFRGNSVRVFPMGSLTASYQIDERSLLYFGGDDLYQMAPSEMFITPFIGYSFPISDNMIIQIESKWMAMNQDTKHGIFEGTGSINGKGNIGVFFGMQYTME